MNFKLMIFEYCSLQTNKNFNESNLFEYIESQNRYFEPRLSEKVNLKDYAEKLSKLAIVNLCLFENKIIGVAAYYCNPKKYDYGFLSFLSVAESYRNNGIAKKMVKEMIAHCKLEGMKNVKTSTWKTSKALNMYINLGFLATYENNSNKVFLNLDLK